MITIAWGNIAERGRSCSVPIFRWHFFFEGVLLSFSYLEMWGQFHRINLFPLLAVLPGWIHVIKSQAESGGVKSQAPYPWCLQLALMPLERLDAHCAEQFCVPGHALGHKALPLRHVWLLTRELLPSCFPLWDPHFSRLPQLLTFPQQLTKFSLLGVMEIFRSAMRIFTCQIIFPSVHFCSV